MELNLQGFVLFIQAYSERLRGLKDTLNMLDNRIGDGDHGTNMARGFEAATAQLEKTPPSDLAGSCDTVAMSLLGHVGGASGPLYGTLFMKMGTVFGKRDEVDEAVLISALQEATEGIRQRGKAQFGDKTMLDVWTPVVDYLQNNLGERSRVTVEVQNAVLATKDRIAKKGRAAYLGPRSEGTCDPGSVSSGAFFEEFFRVCGQDGGTVQWEALVL